MYTYKVIKEDIRTGKQGKWVRNITRNRPLEIGGLYHPRCKDRYTTYFSDISTADDTWSKKELEKIERFTRREAKQQYAERQQEKYERLAKYSLDPDNQEQYQRREDEWKEVAKASDSGIIKENGDTLKMDLQFFAEKDIKNQDSGSLKRSIRKFEKRIREHTEYLENPEKHCPDWDKKLSCEQEGLKRHWKKEIRNFNQSIQDRIEELKERGDYDD